MHRQPLRTYLLNCSLKHMNPQQRILFLSFLVCLWSGMAAIILKNLVHYTHALLISQFTVTTGNLLLLAFPFFGLLFTVLFIKYIVKADIGHGVSKILFAISRGRGRLKPHNTWSSMIASTITVSFGGSVGLEAPIVLTGSSIGSNIGRYFNLNRRSMVLLIGCGAAGAVAGIFKAPIAGVIFALEVLMLDLTMASLIPLLIAAVTAAVLDHFFMGESVLFYYSLTEPFIIKTIPLYILLGAFTGLVSLYFTRANQRIEAWFEKIGNPYRKLLYGGLTLGVLIYFFPPLFGEGYAALKAILTGNGADLTNNSLFYTIRDHYWLFPGFMILILIFKVIATATTTGSGGIGGVFAPSLFMGGVSGFFFARLANKLSFINIPESNFALAGMAGVMAGVMHAPLTAIFLIAEITSGYELFIPLIITATISYITIMYFEPHSVYTKGLAGRGELITHDKDKSALSLLSVEKLIETNFLTIGLDATLGDLVKVIENSERNVFPVIDETNMFHGVVFLNDIRHIVFKQNLYETTLVKDLIYMPDVMVEKTDTMEDVAQKFHSCQHYNLPVLDQGKYCGFVSRANLFSAYRKIIHEFSEE